ncbi:MAG: hypothetical protein KJ718_03040 [Nanoarchaeota archaeon]|nr:hypothetical protein [Nanoarchaeota archaeon]MBU1051505.1 hypothetical protein [Nanoarchaeota archaeon]MBU1988573.1 hypothetical protein [Nanoarchaeota archaeon]
MSDEDSPNLYDGFPKSSSGGVRFIIDVRGKGEREHSLWVNGNRKTGHYVPLPRGVLGELSEASADDIERKLGNLTGGSLGFYMRENRISYLELTTALAQARIAELNMEIEDLNYDLGSYVEARRDPRDCH